MVNFILQISIVLKHYVWRSLCTIITSLLSNFINVIIKQLSTKRVQIYFISYIYEKHCKPSFYILCVVSWSSSLMFLFLRLYISHNDYIIYLLKNSVTTYSPLVSYIKFSELLHTALFVVIPLCNLPCSFNFTQSTFCVFSPFLR